MGRIFSLGYANWKKLDKMLRSLKEYGVEVLVDIRRFPKSKNPEFTGENLMAELPKHGIEYRFMGDLLGGYRRGGYERYTETEDYMRGIRELLKLAEDGNVAIMCLEGKPKYCHRRFIIRTLAKLGVEVKEIER